LRLPTMSGALLSHRNLPKTILFVKTKYIVYKALKISAEAAHLISPQRVKPSKNVTLALLVETFEM
jgi:hypothetical protein